MDRKLEHLRRLETAINEVFADIGDEITAAYLERNTLVAVLARIYPSGIKRTAIEGWDPEWHNCVYIDSPAGQLSWHYHDREILLFDTLPAYQGEWDGHTSEEKYNRIGRLFGVIRP